VQCAVRQAVASAWNWAEAQTHEASVKEHPFVDAAGTTQARTHGLIPASAEVVALAALALVVLS